jgi:hypothetical protein
MMIETPTTEDTMETMTNHIHRIAEHAHCPNAKYHWHRIDGYCQECATAQDKLESNATIQARREVQGYR